MHVLRILAEGFLWFLLYSVCGWIMETLLYIIVQKKVVKRGFLFGPLCPIYGVGAVLSTVLFYGRIENIFLLFLAGSAVCTVLEFMTHLVLEKLFHATWWDYSERRFNIQGRICLRNSLLFGVGIVLIVRVFQPYVMGFTAGLSDAVVYSVALVLYSVFLLDLATTVAGLKNTVALLKNLQEIIGEHVQKGVDTTDEYMNALAERIRTNPNLARLAQTARGRFSPVERLKNAYPKFTMKRYKDALHILFDRSEEDKHRDDGTQDPSEPKD